MDGPEWTDPTVADPCHVESSHGWIKDRPVAGLYRRMKTIEGPRFAYRARSCDTSAQTLTCNRALCLRSLNPNSSPNPKIRRAEDPSLERNPKLAAAAAPPPPPHSSASSPGNPKSPPALHFAGLKSDFLSASPSSSCFLFVCFC
jgi:hypothetical protein